MCLCGTAETCIMMRTVPQSSTDPCVPVLQLLCMCGCVGVLMCVWMCRCVNVCVCVWMCRCVNICVDV